VTVVAVTVSGTAPAIGASAQFTATAMFSDGTTKTVTNESAWASSDLSVATVSSSGLVTATGPGETAISATDEGVRSALPIIVSVSPLLPAGIRFDQIEAAHQWIVGSPVPTQNQGQTYCCWPLPVVNAGSFRFDLSAFPLDVLPSGGQSNIISASEMLFSSIDFSPGTSAVRFDWHRAVGPDTVVYSSTLGSGAYVWAYAFIGHFSWEVNAPGPYYVVVTTPSGVATIDFAVTDSAPNGFRRTRRLDPIGVGRAGGPKPGPNGSGGGAGGLEARTGIVRHSNER
jgi:hypothetical protein